MTDSLYFKRVSSETFCGAKTLRYDAHCLDLWYNTSATSALGSVRFAENSVEEMITGLGDIIDWRAVIHIESKRLHARLREVQA